MLNLILAGIVVLLASVLLIANRVIRRTRRVFHNRSTAAQLRRGAGHMYKIAHAAKTFTRHDAISQLLVQETVRILELALELDPHHRSTRAALQECRETLVSFNAAQREYNAIAGVEYPESDLLLLEAQMHLTEAARLLGGMRKRSLISQGFHQTTNTTLLHAQRALELRINLRQVARSLEMENTTGVDPQSIHDSLQPSLSY